MEERKLHDKAYLLIDQLRAGRINIALKLAIEERTGVTPESVSAFDFNSYEPCDMKRAVELVDRLWPREEENS